MRQSPGRGERRQVMSNTYTNLLFHVVYSTKYRKSIIRSQWQDDLYGYIGGIIRSEKGILLTIGGTSDHVHLFAKLPPTIAVSDMLRLTKTNSSRWVNERGDVRYFEWQVLSQGLTPPATSFRRSAARLRRSKDGLMQPTNQKRTTEARRTLR
jgi:REP element-mobilizing transposase RayT